MENPLPPKYYHTNFEYLLDFVKTKYKSILEEKEWAFLRKYYSLNEDAQCWFIRFTNRKGLFFKYENLSYEELSPIETQLDQLLKLGFIEHLNPEKHSGFIAEILSTLTKVELIEIFSLKSFKNLKKPELDVLISSTFSFNEITILISSKVKLLKVNFEIEISFIKFLFFGNRYLDMTEFVMRDLGLIQYYKQNEDDLVARFETRKDAEDKWMISDQFILFNQLKDQLTVPELLEWYTNLKANTQDLSEVAKPSLARLELRIGKFFEQQKNYDAAIVIYDKLMQVPARERKTRCLVKLGYVEEAKAMCNYILEAPQNADEQYFSEYFLKTLDGKKNKKITTEWLKTADEITVSHIYKYQVELGAIHYYLDLDFNAGFSENFTWRSIFGLVFWDIIFDPSLVAFHHPFQRRPSDLHLPDFYEKRKTQIHELLNSFDNDNESLQELIMLNYAKYYGNANPFVIWEENIWEMTKLMAARIPYLQLKPILIKIAENIVENSRGLPDLLIWNNETIKFIEIKSPNDSLSNQQVAWLSFFKEIGLEAEVLRVKFADTDI